MVVFLELYNLLLKTSFRDVKIVILFTSVHFSMEIQSPERIVESWLRIPQLITFNGKCGQIKTDYSDKPCLLTKETAIHF